MTEKTLCRN